MGDEYLTPTKRLWSHLAGLFGADALKRKFGASPPLEWESVLATLSGSQLARGLEVLLKSGREHVPSLPEFLGMCRQAREWSNCVESLEDQRFDKWDRAGNGHLMAYLRKQDNPKRYHPDHVNGAPGPEGTRRTMVLVAAKNQWAQFMRAAGASVPPDDQRAIWGNLMREAESDIGV